MMVGDDLIFLDYVKTLFNARKIDEKISSEARLGQKTSDIIRGNYRKNDTNTFYSVLLSTACPTSLASDQTKGGGRPG